MDKQTLMKISRTAFEIGQQGKHDIMVDYYSGTNNVVVTIWRNKTRSEEGRKILNSLSTDPTVILFDLLAILNEKEAAA